SPKKSWEGAVGGFVFTVALAPLGVFLFPGLNISVLEWLLIGVVVDVFGSLGDFIESMFKRSAGVKDSGNLIPGHGGLLDRLDSFIFAFPCVIIVYQLFEILQF
ncbi:MAG: phosphatidate cytidylyltransferase, partial [Bacteroidales bacterium]|nr:phosphatidate cytidylyltransferase [Bacteroidales bacterium]